MGRSGNYIAKVRGTEEKNDPEVEGESQEGKVVGPTGGWGEGAGQEQGREG